MAVARSPSFPGGGCCGRGVGCACRRRRLAGLLLAVLPALRLALLRALAAASGHGVGRFLGPAPAAPARAAAAPGAMVMSAPWRPKRRRPPPWPGARGARRLFVCLGGLGLGFFSGSLAAGGRPLPPLPEGGAPMELLVVVLYIAGDVSVFIATNAASSTYHLEAVMLASAVCAWVTGVGTSWLFGGRAALRESLLMKHWVRLLPVAGFFSLALWSQMHAVLRLSGVLVKVLFQLKLPCTVLLSTVLLRQSYTFLQLHALATIFLAVTAFTCLKVGRLESLFASGASGGLTTAALGFLFSGASVGFNVLASLLAEKAFKDYPQVPFYATVAHMKVGEILVAAAMLSLVPGAPVPAKLLLCSPRTAFVGFDAGVWLVVASLVVDSWMSAVIVKRLSSVVKALSKCMSLVVLYVMSVVVLKTESFLLPQMILGLLVVNGTGLFTYASGMKEATEAAAAAGAGPQAARGPGPLGPEAAPRASMRCPLPPAGLSSDAATAAAPAA